jgi:hypothetical protein
VCPLFWGKIKNAKLLSKSNIYELDKIFTLMRCGGMLTDEQIKKMLADLKEKTLNEFEDERAQGIGVPTLDDLEDPENEGCYSAHYIRIR